MKQRISLAMVVSCFALWGLLNNMTDNLVPAFAKIFMINAVNSSLVQVAFYGAYAVLALPAAWLIRRYSFRAGLLVGLGFYIIGALGYIPSAIFSCYELFLVSIFVLACGLSVLETTCNPLVFTLGSKETAIQRLNLAQAFNPIGSITGLFLAKYVILAHLDPATLEERQAMSPETLAHMQAEELFWVCTPYVGLVALALVIWFFFFKTKGLAKNEELATRESNAHSAPNGTPHSSFLTSHLAKPSYIFGVVAQFFYVGVQIGVWTWSTKYIMQTLHINLEAEAATYYLIAMFLFIALRWVCTFLLRFISAARLLLLFAVGGVCSSLCAVWLPATPLFSVAGVLFTSNALALICISGFMSLMFPTIYGLALGGMNENEVKLGAAGLIMAILGGAILPSLMGACIDGGTFSSLATQYAGAEAAVRSAFLLPAFCFAVVGAYAFGQVAKRK